MHPHATPFTYPEERLSSCASYLLNDQKYDRGEINACRELFVQHANYYNRPPLNADEEAFFQNFWLSGFENNNDGDGGINTGSKRIRAFLENVKFIHTHNNQEETRHEVTLNRFSDLSLDELPLMTSSSSNASNNANGDSKEGNIRSYMWMNELESELNSPTGTFLNLDSEELIIQLGEKIQQRKQQTNNPSYSILFQQINSLFKKQKWYHGIFDSWWWIGDNRQNTNTPKSTTATIEEHSHHSSSTAGGKSFTVDSKNEMNGIEEDDSTRSKKKDEWEEYLNWATGDNPDGVGIVHEAMDQGLCGSCWAVSALGSMEASIVRNMAYMAYEETYKHPTASTAKIHRKSDLRSISISTAQDVELSSLQTADLSVQELVDCDTRYDQGCAGGNPLLAFYFLHRFGVTSTSSYPYTGKQDTCQYHKVDSPIATVETWGILTPDHENNMQKVLRYIGPVAVGLVGADPAFLSYKGGVFKARGGKCASGEADHAMLIVGYGIEENKDGTKTKYWIARNSWGTGWGENGYIRMERIGGKKGSRGVCEIARSPSVALGGMFTKDAELSVYDRDFHRSHHNSKGHLGSGYSKLSPRMASDPSPLESIIHRIRQKFGFVQKGIMMSTLHGSEEESSTQRALPMSEILAAMSLLCLFTYVYRRHKRRQTRNNRARTQSESELNSVSTNDLSVAYVCNDSFGERNGSEHAQTNVGESTALLSDCSDRVTYL